MPPESTGVLGTLGINGKLFLAQLVNIGIVLFVMWRFVYRPLLKMMDERSKKISDGLANAKKAERELSEAVSDKERMIREANASARVLVEEAGAKAEAVRLDKMKQAKDEIEKVVVEAKERIAAERSAAFDALKTDIADLVSLATGKVAGAMDEKAQRGLIAKAITDIEKA